MAENRMMLQGLQDLVNDIEDHSRSSE